MRDHASSKGAVLADPNHKADLDALEARLAAAQAKHKPKEVARSALAGGTRYAAEIAIATVVGGAIGWWLDGLLGTKPWLAILFLLLGVAAGFMNLLRAVNREAAAVTAEQKAAALRGAQEAELRDALRDEPGDRDEKED